MEQLRPDGAVAAVAAGRLAGAVLADAAGGTGDAGAGIDAVADPADLAVRTGDAVAAADAGPGDADLVFAAGLADAARILAEARRCRTCSPATHLNSLVSSHGWTQIPWLQTKPAVGTGGAVVDLAVAVVVDAVAHLVGRHDRLATGGGHPARSRIP